MSVTAPPAPPTARTATPDRSPAPIALRFLASGLILAGYFILYSQIIATMTTAFESLTGSAPSLETPKVIAVTALGLLLVATWWAVIKRDIRFHAPILITYILAIGATMAIELVLARFIRGKWPHLSSAYITGISVGILIKSPDLWPFVMCGLISITSKYVLRVGGRHLWNPSNFGVVAML